MPTPTVGGEASVRGLASDECGNWLGLLLLDRGDLRTSSRSLKKWGVSHTDRLALGGHRHPGAMADTYSRDALARPLRLLARVIDAVARELFFPDASRAGRFAGQICKKKKKKKNLLEHGDFCEPSRAPDCQDPESSYWDESSRSWSWIALNAGAQSIKAEADLDAQTVASSLSEHGKQESESESDRVTSTDSDSDSSTSSSSVKPAERVIPKLPDGFRFLQRKKLGTLHLLLWAESALRAARARGWLPETRALSIHRPQGRLARALRATRATGL